MKITRHRNGTVTIKAESWEQPILHDAFRARAYELENSANSTLRSGEPADVRPALLASSKRMFNLSDMFDSYGTDSTKVPLGTIALVDRLMGAVEWSEYL